MDRKFFSLLGATAILIALITMSLIMQVRMIENAADFGQTEIENTFYAQGGVLRMMSQGDSFGTVEQNRLRSMVWVGSEHCGADLPGFARDEKIRLSLENAGINYDCPIEYFIRSPLIVEDSGSERPVLMKVGLIE